MKKLISLIKNTIWAIKHPKFAWCWLRHGKPYSAVFATLIISSVLCFTASAQDTNTSSGILTSLWDAISQSGLAKATNYSFEPYATYAPNAPKGSKIGGGLFAAYNINNYVGAGLGVDYLGQFSLVSANVQLKYPTHPFSSFGGSFTNIAVTPFAIAGLGKAMSGTSSGAIAVTDAGAYVSFGHLWGGQFNAGAAYGRWDNAGIFSGTRYHVFAGWSKGF